MSDKKTRTGGMAGWFRRTFGADDELGALRREIATHRSRLESLLAELDQRLSSAEADLRSCATDPQFSTPEPRTVDHLADLAVRVTRSKELCRVNRPALRDSIDRCKDFERTAANLGGVANWLARRFNSERSERIAATIADGHGLLAQIAAMAPDPIPTNEPPPVAMRQAARAFVNLHALCLAQSRLSTLIDDLRHRRSTAQENLQRAAKVYETDERERRIRERDLREAFQGLIHDAPWIELDDLGIHRIGEYVAARRERRLASLHGGSSVLLSAAVDDEIRRLEREPAQPPSATLPSEAAVHFARAARRVIVLRDASNEIGSDSDRIAKEVARFDVVLGATSDPVEWFSTRSGTGITAHDAAMVAEATSVAQRALQLSNRLANLLAGVDFDVHKTDAEIRHAVENSFADYSAVFDGVLIRDRSAEVGRPMPGLATGILNELREIHAKVDSQQLQQSGLRVTLRRYQEFGVRYMLAFERTLLGDEMGLGKTIEALAAMNHVMFETPGAHFLVVAPASLTGNWMAEIRHVVPLHGYLLQGPDKVHAGRQWLRHGGIAVTSYDTLSNLVHRSNVFADVTIEFLIVDEAHYVKSPETKRSRSVSALAESAQRVCLMTGTPLMNRLEEFKALTSIVRPESREIFDRHSRHIFFPPGILTDSSRGLERFQLDLASIYLRRNREDCITELPEKVELEQWVDLSSSQRAAYDESVDEGHIMKVRRAASLTPGSDTSAKLEFVDELLDETFAEGRSVVFFSYFLDVLNAVEANEHSRDRYRILRIDGSVYDKSAVATSLHESNVPCLLIAQVDAGGVGLNLQKASVVVLAEPQWNPAREDQAISRVYRMGQARMVTVHRLLARDTVDERIRDLVQRKGEIFERYARPSAAKNASADATDDTFVDIPRELKDRLLQIERERLAARRAGLGANRNTSGQ